MTDTTDIQAGTTPDMTDIPTADVPVTTDNLSLTEAAAQMGVSERTILRRIEKGKLKGWKVAAERGEIWRVQVPEMSALADKAPVALSATTDNSPARVTDTADMPQSPDLMKALEIIEVIRREHEETRREFDARAEHLRQEASEKAEKIAELTGTAAHWQARAVAAEQTVQRLLMAPKDEPAPEPAAQPERRPWWKRILR